MKKNFITIIVSFLVCLGLVIAAPAFAKGGGGGGGGGGKGASEGASGTGSTEKDRDKGSPVDTSSGRTARQTPPSYGPPSFAGPKTVKNPPYGPPSFAGHKPKVKKPKKHVPPPQAPAWGERRKELPQ